MVNPFDLKTVFLAKHAQHVVLIHFPIALFITAVAFDLIAQWTKRLAAWQWALEGQKLKGILLMHLILGCTSTVLIWLVWWVHFRARRRAGILPSYRLAVEFLGVAIVALTGHLGGFLSGVNGPG